MTRLCTFRVLDESQYGQVNIDELVQMLAEATSLDEQGDILHYLVYKVGHDFEIHAVQVRLLFLVPVKHTDYFLMTISNSKITMNSDFQTGETVSIRDLIRTLYETACMKKNWGIVRHTAGLLGKRVEDLSKSVTDLLVRQKQVSRDFVSSDFLHIHLVTF